MFQENMKVKWERCVAVKKLHKIPNNKQQITFPSNQKTFFTNIYIYIVLRIIMCVNIRVIILAIFDKNEKHS